MEPRKYKQLSEVLLAVGIALAAIGVAMILGLDMRLEGALVLILGAGMSLISLPTFIILMILTVNKKE